MCPRKTAALPAARVPTARAPQEPHLSTCRSLSHRNDGETQRLFLTPNCTHVNISHNKMAIAA